MTPIQKFLTALAAMTGIAVAATLIDSSNPDIDIPLVPDLSVGGRELPEVRPGNLVDSETIRAELTELTSVSRYKITLAVYEPQSGQVGELSTYPNRNHIFAITGD